METEVFKNIILNKIQSYKIYEDEILIAILDANPLNPGHILLIPKKQKENVLLEDDKTISHMFLIAKKIQKLQKEKLNSKGTKIIFNNGELAGQKVFHTHMHLIPYYGVKNPTLSNSEIYNLLK